MADLDRLTIGLVNEIFIEKARDGEKYDTYVEADQAAFDRF